MQDPSPLFSVVIPICNEEENIHDLYNRLIGVLEKLCSDEGHSADSYEIIMVDDGSTDRSWEIIKGIHAQDSKIKGLSFSRNFGHHIALTAGLDSARGRAVILIDGDLQDPPEAIPELYDKLKQGNDLVYGIRQHRNDPLLKKISSSFFWWLIKVFSNVDMPKGQTMLRIMSRRLVNTVKEMRESARFIHGIIAWAGFNTAKVEVKHTARLKGKSKYNLTRMFGLAFNAVTSFSTVPLRIATLIGFASSFISLLAGVYYIYRKIFLGVPIMGYASIIVSIFFVGGIQLLIFGIFGEYLAKTYQQVKNRPLYILKEHIS